MIWAFNLPHGELNIYLYFAYNSISVIFITVTEKKERYEEHRHSGSFRGAHKLKKSEEIQRALQFSN